MNTYASCHVDRDDWPTVDLVRGEVKIIFAEGQGGMLCIPTSHADYLRDLIAQLQTVEAQLDKAAS